VLVQMGTNRTEGLIATTLDHAALHNLWQTSTFRPREKMVLANAGSVLAEVYDQGLTIDQSAARHAPPPAVEPESLAAAAAVLPELEPVAEPDATPEPPIAPTVGQFERVDLSPDESEPA
jgi:hypothetical protein